MFHINAKHPVKKCRHLYMITQLQYYSFPETQVQNCVCMLRDEGVLGIKTHPWGNVKVAFTEYVSVNCTRGERLA